MPIYNCKKKIIKRKKDKKKNDVDGEIIFVNIYDHCKILKTAFFLMNVFIALKGTHFFFIYLHFNWCCAV